MELRPLRVSIQELERIIGVTLSLNLFQAFPVVCSFLSPSLSVLAASLRTHIVDICHFEATQHLYPLPNSTLISYGGQFKIYPGFCVYSGVIRPTDQEMTVIERIICYSEFPRVGLPTIQGHMGKPSVSQEAEE